MRVPGRRAAGGGDVAPGGEAPTVEVVDVVKTFPGAPAALDHITLTCEPGRFLVLLGPSGSGKTTLLRTIAGIERVSSGTIRIGGTTVGTDRLHVPPERRELAMVFQDYALWPHLTAAQNVAYALRRRRLGPDAARQRTEAMLERVGLGRLAHRYPSELSGGEQQRVALARALVAHPGLLLFDEPLSNLDADLRERLRVEIATLVRELGPTVVYITHDQSEAFALADEVGILQRGRLVQLGTPETIYQHPATAFVARFTGLAGEIPVHVGAPAGDDRVAVTVAGTPVVARAPRTLDLGAPARMLVRPSAGTLLPATSTDVQVLGRVRDVAFRGRGYEHVVELADGSRLHGLFAEERWGRGDHVGVALDPSGCLVLEADPIGDDGLRGQGPQPTEEPAALAVEEPLVDGIG